MSLYEDYENMHERSERMSQELASLQETLEIFQDAELIENIREGMKALQNGDTVSLEEARRALGLTRSDN